METPHAFEWDKRKRRSNLVKHGIDFIDAIAIFNDPYLMIQEDDRENYGEPRFHAIGEARGNLVLVVYALRDDVTRIISARKATKRERQAYYRNAR